MGTAATTPTEGFILCVRTNVRWTGQPTTVSSHGYADARRLVRRATRALRHPARASASRSPVTNTFRCPLPSRCHDPRRTASYCVACCPAGALGRRATDRDEQGHFALFFERNGSAPSKDRTCDLGFRKALLYPTELRGRAAEAVTSGGDAQALSGFVRDFQRARRGASAARRGARRVRKTTELRVRAADAAVRQRGS